MDQCLEWFEHRPQQLAQVHVIWFVSNIKFTFSIPKNVKLIWDLFRKENAYVCIDIPINRITHNRTRPSSAFFHLFPVILYNVICIKEIHLSYGNFHPLGKGNLLIFSLKYQIIKQIIKSTFFSVLLLSLLFLNLPSCYCLLTDQIAKRSCTAPQHIWRKSQLIVSSIPYYYISIFHKIRPFFSQFYLVEKIIGRALKCFCLSRSR